MVLTLPTLYVVTKLEKTKLWQVQVEGDTIVRRDHFVGGKVKDATHRQCQGTNVGRSNARTAHQQACFEACRAWVKQLEKGYQPDPQDTEGQQLYQQIIAAKSGGTNHDLPQLLLNIQTGQDCLPTPPAATPTATIVKPMLADKLTDKLKHFQPDREAWFLQPKLDGVRCVAQQLEDGSVLLSSRTGKPLKHLGHIKQQLAQFFTQQGPHILDGELYVEDLVVDGHPLQGSAKFDKISGACRPTRNKPADYEQQICFHIFDLADMVATQQDRLKHLQELFREWPAGALVLVPTVSVTSMDQVREHQNRLIEHGYEGVVLRRGSGLYEQRRTVSLLKYKEFQDSEFVIMGASEGKGTEAGCMVWRCCTPSGLEFDVRPQGSFEHRQQLFRKRERYMGKLLTVKYQELSKDGVPRFPVGVAVRDYE